MIVLLHVITLSLLVVLIVPRRMRWAAVTIAILVAVIAVVTDSAPERRFWSAVGLPSITSLTLLLDLAMRKFDRALLPRRDRILLLSIAAGSAVVLEPAALGFLPLDLYRVGFLPVTPMVTAIAAALVVAPRTPAAACTIVAGLLAFDLRLLGSSNAWDYFVDPIVGVVSISYFVVRAFMTIGVKRGVAIRKAAREDAAGILACLHRAFEPFRKQYSPEGFRDTVLTPETIDQRLQQMTLFVAITPSGEIVGTIGCNCLDTNEGHIRGMAVLPEWQGRGVAQRLLDAVDAELRASGCRIVTLDTTEPLHRAVRFYEKNGFQATGTIGDFFGMSLFQYMKRLEND
jgi:ribosomal protein S18 acetylase RimI-like enzyme